MRRTPGQNLWVYLGLFFATLATLMHEILLTRIFSVTMWYHFAFMAISVAMFGMTVGAVIVYLIPSRFCEERAPSVLANYSLWFAISVVASFWIYLQIPFLGGKGMKGVFYLAAMYVVIAIPFLFSGVTVAVALTKVRAPINRLYAVDLLGASLGCVVLVGVLELTDAASAVLAVGALAALSAVFFAQSVEQNGRRRWPATAVAMVVGVAAVLHAGLAAENRPILQIVDTADRTTDSYQYVRWNSHSRVTVFGDPDRPSEAYGWGLSEKTGATDVKVRQLSMTIDTWAATVITGFDGDIQPLTYLKDDVTNMPHYLRGNADVMVVGVGGGRDVLSALVFEQKSVTGVEINRAVLGATTEEFGDFSGRLDRHPKVTLKVDEARSYIARVARQFDIIQLSLTDTWAATAAGAFVLTENSLYTVEAWISFLEHLRPRGILSVSRWYYPRRPGEALRITALAGEALRRIGVRDPRQHVVMIRAPKASGLSGVVGNGVATILVSPTPFSAADLSLLRVQADRLGFPIMVSPDSSEAEIYPRILGSAAPEELYRSYPLDISPPTDDRPFFFQMLRLKDVTRSLEASAWDPNRTNLEAMRLLAALLLIMVVLTALCIIAPLVLRASRRGLRGSLGHFVFFAAIGLGFMFVEISQMQRLMVMLGHPTYALTVVLFTLLVGTGLGSLFSERLVQGGVLSPLALLLILFAVLTAFGFLTPAVARHLATATTPARIAGASLILVVIGFFLGMPFPLGMRAAQARSPELLPWLWGINGACSVLCSVLAVTVALSWGIAASFAVGVCCYAVAALAYYFVGRLPMG